MGLKILLNLRNYGHQSFRQNDTPPQDDRSRYPGGDYDKLDEVPFDQNGAIFIIY